MTTQTIDTKQPALAIAAGIPVYGEPGAEDQWIGGWDTTCAALREGQEPYFWHAITFSMDGGAAAHQDRIQRDLAMTIEWLGNVTTFLVGEVADCLYAALSGRGFAETPDDAEAGRALTARAAIADLAAEGEEGYPEVQAAVEAFGPFIKPWLATTKLGEHGRIITDDPCYERIPLTLST